MSLDSEHIKRSLGSFSSKYGPSVILPATVTAVNDDDTVAVVFSDESTVDDVRLKAVVKGGSKIIIVPAVNSVVLVGKIENSDEYVVLSADEITEVLYEIDGVKFSVDESGFLIKKGGDTLKQVLTLLIESVQTIIVIQGTNPDRIKLQQALTKLNNILR